jgi:hypothetical protein
MPIDYQHVVRESRNELAQCVRLREEMDKRINELRTALRALIQFVPEEERAEVFEEVKNAKRKGVSLAEAIVDILGQPEHKAGLTSNQLREQLEKSGFDLSEYSQPLAAVMTTLQRLTEQKRVGRAFTKDTKNVLFRKPTLADLATKPKFYGK